MNFELRRKLFHLLSLGYVVALYRLTQNQFIVLISVLLVLDVLIEILRLRVPLVRAKFPLWTEKLLREGEQNRMSGVFWMLVGVLLTALILPQKDLAATALLYLILGDAAASLVGKWLGGRTWHAQSNKRVSGSAACFLVCLGTGIVVAGSSYSNAGLIIGAFLATVLEFGFGSLNDNLTIPVGSAIFFRIFYGGVS